MSTCVGGGSATVNSPVWGFMLDGASVSTYHDVSTADYPHTAGCYRGSREETVVANRIPASSEEKGLSPNMSRRG